MALLVPQLLFLQDCSCAHRRTLGLTPFVPRAVGRSVGASWVVYHLHGKPIRFEIVLMVSKISDRKSHSDYALSI
jgi:hypothetical protein